jgi:uncharacterized membrane protein
MTMSPSHALFFAFLAGVFSGLRALTPLAVTAWGAHAKWLKLPTPILSWLGAMPAAIIFTILALAEIINDKLPKTPPRTAPPGLIARILTGGFTGACLTAATGTTVKGVVLGIAGALVGTFGGYQARKGLVSALHVPDYVIAVLEDLVTIGASLWVVSRS